MTNEYQRCFCIAVSNTGQPLAISGITQSSSGNIYVTSDNAITVSGAIQVLGTAGDVGLQAASGIAVNMPVTVPTNGIVALKTTAGDVSQDPTYGTITATALSAVATSGNVSLSNEANVVGTIAGSANNSATGFLFYDSTAFTVGTVVGVGNIPSVSGITSTGAVAGYGITLDAPSGPGGITIGASIDASASGVDINSGSAGIIQQSGTITGTQVSLVSGTSVGSSAAPVLTSVGSGGLSAGAYGGDASMSTIALARYWSNGINSHGVSVHQHHGNPDR